METKELIVRNEKILAELRAAVGVNDGIFDKERFLELQHRLDDMELFSARVDSILGAKPRMRIGYISPTIAKQSFNDDDLEEVEKLKAKGLSDKLATDHVRIMKEFYALNIRPKMTIECTGAKSQGTFDLRALNNNITNAYGER